MRKGRAILLQLVLMFALISAVRAQPLDPLSQLQLTQPSIEINSNATATATFDPPVIRSGGQATYRVSFNALEDSIRWPRDVLAPLDLNLRPSARGQMFIPGPGKFAPKTTFNNRAQPTKTGTFTVPQFTVMVYGRPVIVPAATLKVVDDPTAPNGPAVRLQIEFAETNLYAGQPVTVRTFVPADVPVIPQLAQFKLAGEGFVADTSPGYSQFGPIETSLTPIVSGKVTVTAQGFSSGLMFRGAQTIQNVNAYIAEHQNMLLDSDPVTLNVKPLPRAGQLPGFAGAIGVFTNDPPRLLQETVRVGDIVKMEITFRGDVNVTRLVMPPPPVVPGWQIFPAVAGSLPFTNRPAEIPGNIGRVIPKTGVIVPPANVPAPANVATMGPNARFNFTMIPLTNGLTATPRIPFSFFDPKRGAYVDLSIPPVPITVLAGAVQPDWPVGPETNTVAISEKKLTLSATTSVQGRTNASLTPLQQQPWFVGVQVMPVLGFVGLWAWDRRRRYLEQHPHIVLRRRARRALRRERQTSRRAARAGDTSLFVSAAVNAMRVACAPHYPAEARALVGRDVLELFEEGERTGKTGEVVRKFFSFADANAFAANGAETNGLLSLQPELERVLQKLEAKL